MKIAVINAGSSSLKFKLFEMDSQEIIYEKLIEHIGEKGSPVQNHREALESLEIDFEGIDAIGHRVVHGGEKFSSAVLIDDEVEQKIESLIPLAPLHNRANLEGLHVSRRKSPDIPQIAVFDTAFHTTMREEAYLYALPIRMYEKEHIRRYGFHGTSHEYILKQTAQKLGRDIEELNIISLHLGNGASICAIEGGKSIDTSMGFTPLEGLIMGSRSGDIDPAIVLYMQRELGLSIDEVETLLNRESGLLGICSDNDVRNILKSKNPRARLALSMMIRRIQKYIGSYMVLLEKVDAIVFTGGIGENSHYIRESVMSNKILQKIEYFTIKTDEELEIARQTHAIIKQR